MAWAGHIADQETARKAAGSALAGQKIILVLEASLSSVAVAQAAAATLGAGLNIADQIWVKPVQRGYKIASNLSGTFSSSYATLYASLPSSAGHIRNMIHS